MSGRTLENGGEGDGRGRRRAPRAPGLRARDWPEAYDVWARADLAGLPAADLDDLATASELLGNHDTTVLALQQEFRLHEQAVTPEGLCTRPSVWR